MLKSIDKSVRRLLIDYGRCVTLNFNYELRYGHEVWRIRVDRTGKPLTGAEWEQVCNVRKVGY